MGVNLHLINALRGCAKASDKKVSAKSDAKFAPKLASDSFNTGCKSRPAFCYIDIGKNLQKCVHIVNIEIKIP